MVGFTVRSVTNMDEIHGIVNVQRKAWQMNDLEIVAPFEMKAVSSFGTVLIAVDDEDTVIGFIYALPYKNPNTHYSHMMATLPEWEGKGVGFALKKEHRRVALNSENDVNSIIWTVDPLLSNNSYLNFTKLGCVCSTYYPDYYGDPEAVGIYRGIPTDRFLVEWQITTDRVKRRMQDYKADQTSEKELFERSPQLNRIENRKYVQVADVDHETSFSIEIPADYQILKNESIELAKEWRYVFRGLCQNKFSDGWEIIDFHSFMTGNQRRNYYEFSKKK